MSDFLTMVSYLIGQIIRFFEEIPFFDTGLRFIDFSFTLILFYVVVRVLVLNFWGSGHE